MPSTPVASVDESDDSDGANDDNTTASDDEVNGDASSPSDDEMFTWHSYPFHSWQKGGVILDIMVVIVRGRVSIGDFWQGKCSFWGM